MSTHTLSEATFDRLRAYVKSETGIAVANGKSYLIESRFGTILDEEGIENFEKLADLLEAGARRPLVDRIINAITTNETLWFRDDGPWEILRKDLLPRFAEMLQSGESSKIRIWSAASATGQEPYSLAMMIREYVEDEAAPDVKVERFEIVATDISSDALTTAREGRYELLAASRGITPETLERFFDTEEGSVSIKPSIRSMVKFEQFDLQRSFLGMGQFDMILCRNVLIYFANDLKVEIFEKMQRALKPKGSLILGGSESAQGALKLFKTARCGRHLYYMPRDKEQS